MTEFIKDQDFCKINTDKFEKDEGVAKGQLVYIAGHRALPISKEDPYTQRIKFFVHLLDKDEQIVFGPIYLMDPSSLDKVSDSKQAKLTKKLTDRMDAILPEHPTVQ